ncbi:ThiJ/PfpI [Panaeolus papilionaceus]|nr:ThiJ/PfpI [Panaeolus papilionaceus]
MPRETWDIGILMLPYFQFLDMAGPIDLIANISIQTIEALQIPAPQRAIDNAPIINYHYISSTMDPVKATSGPLLPPTHTYDTCPRLDWLLVPGPSPLLQLTDDDKGFIKRIYEDPTLKGLILICTAGFMVAQTGILDGLSVCANKLAIKVLHEAGALNPKVKWVGEKRFHHDGRVWSSGGITAGMDLAYAWLVAQGVDGELLEMAKIGAEFEPKPAVPDKFAAILDGVQYQKE